MRDRPGIEERTSPHVHPHPRYHRPRGRVTAARSAGCSLGDGPSPRPTPSPDLSRPPASVAVNGGPFEAGPFEPPQTGAYLGAWIKPDKLTHEGRVDAVGALEQSLGRRLDIVNTYRRFEQPVGTESDREFLDQGATLMVSWATGDNRSITAGRHDDLIRAQAKAIRKVKEPVLLRMRWEMDRPNLRATMWSGPGLRRGVEARAGDLRAGTGEERVLGVVPDRGGLHPRRRPGLLPG